MWGHGSMEPLLKTLNLSTLLLWPSRRQRINVESRKLPKHKKKLYLCSVH